MASGDDAVPAPSCCCLLCCYPWEQTRQPVREGARSHAGGKVTEVAGGARVPRGLSDLRLHLQCGTRVCGLVGAHYAWLKVDGDSNTRF